MNKRGQSDDSRGFWKIIIFFVSAFLIFSGWWYFLETDVGKKWVKNISIDTAIKGFDTYFGKAFSWMTYVFGGVPEWLVEQVGENSAIVITLFAWLLLLVTFGDIFQNFSTFSAPASWVIAFAIAVIAANIKAVVIFLGLFVGIFAFLGGIAVIIGLFAALVAFLAVNWGIGSLGPFILRRRVFIKAEKEAIESEAGGMRMAAAIKGIEHVREALARTKKKGK